MKNFSIAIDGPSGSGKSTIAKIIAKKLDILYFDTGAMYRAIALYFIDKGKSLDDINYIVSKLDFIDISIKFINSEQHLFLNGADVNSKLRNPEITEGSSIVSKIKEVRQKLVSIQKELAKEQSVIMDGRDIGTNVLPNATLKIYLYANIDERAKRRYNDYLNSGENLDFEQVKQDIIKRDFEDSNRQISPLKKADAAVEIDTTNLTIDEAVQKILSYLDRK